MEAAKPKRRFGRNRLSDPNSPRANILDVVGVTGCPALPKALDPSTYHNKVPILGPLRSHSPKHARAITVIHCILLHPDDAFRSPRPGAGGEGNFMQADLRLPVTI